MECGLFRVSQRATVAVVTPLLLVAGGCCSATGQLVVVCHGGVRGMATTTFVCKVGICRDCMGGSMGWQGHRWLFAPA